MDRGMGHYRLPDLVPLEALEDAEEALDEERVVLHQLVVLRELLGRQHPQLRVDGGRLVRRIARHFPQRENPLPPFVAVSPCNSSHRSNKPQKPSAGRRSNLALNRGAKTMSKS